MNDAADHHALVDARAPDAACPICGSRKWRALRERPITLLSFEPADEPRMRMLAVGCRVCAYVRFHDADMLERPAA